VIFAAATKSSVAQRRAAGPDRRASLLIGCRERVVALEDLPPGAAPEARNRLQA